MKKKSDDMDDQTQQYTFRIPVTIKAEMERIAKEDDRSLAKQIIFALRQHISDRKPKDGSSQD